MKNQKTMIKECPNCGARIKIDTSAGRGWLKKSAVFAVTLVLVGVLSFFAAAVFDASGTAGLFHKFMIPMTLVSGLVLFFAPGGAKVRCPLCSRSTVVSH